MLTTLLYYLSSDYLVLSEFTLALFEDSGWYKANYTALYDLQQNPLQWGKGIILHSHLLKAFVVFMYLKANSFAIGLGCDFLTERCSHQSVFPYLCDTSETQLVCTYDHLTKVWITIIMS